MVLVHFVATVRQLWSHNLAGEVVTGVICSTTKSCARHIDAHSMQQFGPIQIVKKKKKWNEIIRKFDRVYNTRTLHEALPYWRKITIF